MDPFGLYARFYDLDLADYDEDVLLVEELAGRCGSPILELACGTARLMLPLARRGFEITGVDISPAMLERAHEKLTAAGFEDRIALIHQDMRELTLDRRFNLVVLAVSSFMHLLTLEDQIATLVRIRRHMNPGGVLFMDLFNPDLGRLLEAPGQVVLDKVMQDPENGARVLKFHTQRVDLAEQRIDVTYLLAEVDADGFVQRTLFPFSMRYLFRGELELLLRYTGFEVEALYGSYDLDDYSGDSERMIAVARLQR